MTLFFFNRSKSKLRSSIVTFLPLSGFHSCRLTPLMIILLSLNKRIPSLISAFLNPKCSLTISIVTSFFFSVINVVYKFGSSALQRETLSNVSSITFPSVSVSYTFLFLKSNTSICFLVPEKEPVRLIPAFPIRVDKETSV